MNFFKQSLFCFILALTSSSLAAASLSGKVKLLSHEVSGSYVQLVDSSDQVITTNPGSCANTDLLYLPKTHGNYTVLSSSLLMAQTSQQSVTLELDGCEQNRNKIAFFRLGDWSGVNAATPKSASNSDDSSSFLATMAPKLMLHGSGAFPNDYPITPYAGWAVPPVTGVWGNALTIEGRGYINYLDLPPGVRVTLRIDGNIILNKIMPLNGAGDPNNNHRLAIIDSKSNDYRVYDRFYFNKKIEIDMLGGNYHSASARYNIIKLSN